MIDHNTGGIFVSYNYEDLFQVEQLHAELLKTWGIEVYVDRQSMPASADWQKEVDQLIHQSRVCLVVLGANGWGPSQRYELAQIALRAASTPETRVVQIDLVLLEGANRLLASEWIRYLGPAYQNLSWVDWAAADLYATGRIAAAILRLRVSPVAQDVRAVMALRQQATRWLHAARNPALLYTGGVLRDAEQIALRLPDLMTQDASTFLAASSLAEDERRRAERRRLRFFIAGLSFLSIALAIVAMVAFVFQRKAKTETGIAEQAAAAAIKFGNEARDAEKKERQQEVKAIQAQKAAETAGKEREVARQTAVARSLASQAAGYLADHPDDVESAVLLAIEAARREPSVAADRTLRSLASLLPESQWVHSLKWESLRPERPNQIAFSGDGAFVATASNDSSLQVFSTKTGERVQALQPFPPPRLWGLLHRYERPPVNVLGLALNRLGSIVIAAGEQENAAIELPARRILWRHPVDRLPLNPVPVRFTLDDRFLIGAPRDDSFGESFFPEGFLNAATGLPESKPNGLTPSNCKGARVLFDRNASIVVCVEAGQLVIAGRDQKEPRKIAVPPDAGHADAAVTTQDSHCIALTTTANYDKHRLLVYDTSTGDSIIDVTLSRVSYELAFSDDGRLLAVGNNDGLISIYSLWTRGLIVSFPALARAHTMEFEPASHLLALSTERDLTQVFDSRHGAEVLRTSGGYPHALSFAPNGNSLAIAGEDYLQMVEAPRVEYAFPPKFEGDPYKARVPFYYVEANISSDDKALFQNSAGRIKVMFLDNRPPVSRSTVCRGSPTAVHTDRNAAVCLVYRGGNNGGATLFDLMQEDLKTGAPRKLDSMYQAGFGSVGDQQIRWSANGTTLLLFNRYDQGREVFIYDLQKHTRAITVMQEPIRDADVSGDGKRVIVFGTSSYVLLDSSAHASPVALSDRCNSAKIAVDAHGATLAMACGSELRVYSKGHKAPFLRAPLPAAASGLKFNSTGRYLVVWAGDTALIYATPEFAERARIRHQWSLQAAAMLPDERQIVTVGEDASLKRHAWPVDRVIDETCRIVDTKTLDPSVWHFYIPGENPRPTCPAH